MTRNYFTVAIIGRTNVGKSTLFNTLIGFKKAITEQSDQTTRDVNTSLCSWRGKEFLLSDTAGLLDQAKTKLEYLTQAQTKFALTHADLILFVVDAKRGLTPSDKSIAKKLQKSKIPTILVTNKIDSINQIGNAQEFFKLNLGNPVSISALTGSGTGDLLDEVVRYIPKQKLREDKNDTFKIGIFGKPNAGKSSLFNQITKSKSAIVSDVPGTTLDTLDSIIYYENTSLVFIDTAGLRRKSKIYKKTEKLASARSLRLIKNSDLCLLLIDTSESLSRQEQRIAAGISKYKKPTIIINTKWDLGCKHISKENQTKTIQKFLGHLSYAPQIFTSSKTGYNISDILPQIKDIYNNYRTKIRQDLLSKFLTNFTRRFPPPRNAKRKDISLVKLTQTRLFPKTFLIEIERSPNLPDKYLNVLEKQLRKKFNLSGFPISFKIKKYDRNNRTRKSRP